MNKNWLFGFLLAVSSAFATEQAFLCDVGPLKVKGSFECNYMNTKNDWLLKYEISDPSKDKILEEKFVDEVGTRSVHGKLVNVYSEMLGSLQGDRIGFSFYENEHGRIGLAVWQASDVGKTPISCKIDMKQCPW